MHQQDQTSQGGGLDAEQQARARDFVEKAHWTFARTVPEHPHWYALRAWLSPEQQNAFDWFAALIARHGYGGRFWGQSWTYLDLGDGFKYWESRTLDRTGRIINRTRNDSPEPAQSSKPRAEHG
jgi:hypothetical protein